MDLTNVSTNWPGVTSLYRSVGRPAKTDSASCFYASSIFSQQLRVAFFCVGGNVLRSAENLRMPVTRGADRRLLAGGSFDWLLDTKSIGADRLDEAERVREPARPTLIVLEAPDRAGRFVG